MAVHHMSKGVEVQMNLAFSRLANRLIGMGKGCVGEE